MAASPPTQHRDNTAVWLLQVCSQEQASPHIFCLAVNMMDRVLSRVEVSPPQLPLLASACLLVSWKIRQHKPIPASSIVKHSQAAFLQEELLEWEVYVLSKLQWSPPTVVATDLLDEMLRRVSKHRPDLSMERTRAGVESLLLRALLSYRMSSFSPAVVAAATILLTIRPNFSSPSSTTTTTTTSTPVSRTPFQVLESPIPNVEANQAKPSDLERVTKSILKASLVEKSVLLRCLETLETVLSPSPSSSSSSSFSSPPPSAVRSLFTEGQEKTPTKILEAATSITN